MKVEYDKYYQTENLFGEPYQELIEFYSSIQPKGKLLDLGCGQGRDSIPLARLGYSVTGIDNSKVGIEQLNQIAEKENLSLKGIVEDIYTYSNFSEFNFILLNSIFHFGIRQREKESNFLIRLIKESTPNTLITVCIQKTGKKLEILNSIFSSNKSLTIINQSEVIYNYVDKNSKHSSETKYEIVTVKKTKVSN